MAIECKHGQLARSCNICALEAELAEVTAQRDKLQELINAPEVEPALVVEVEPDYWHRGHYCEGSKPHINPLKVWELPVGTKLYTAPPAPSVPDGWRPFLTDVITAAGLLEHGKRDKGLAGRIGKFAFDAMRAAPTPAEPPTDLPTWENGDDPLVGGGLISRGVVDFATVGIWPTKPAPSVPVEPMENIALNEWLDKTEWVQKQLNTFPVSSLGMHRADVMRLEIDRLRKLLAAPQPPKLSDERILELWASNSGRPVTMGKARIIAQARAIERELFLMKGAIYTVEVQK